MIHVRLLALGLCFAAALAFPATPQTKSTQETATYTISVAGLLAGRLSLAIQDNGRAYAVKSRAESAGLAGLFSSFLVNSSVKGHIRSGNLRPDSYKSQSEGARAGRGAEISYQAGVPKIIKSAEEPHPDAPVIDPAKMGGTVDPLTAMYAVLRTVPEGQRCKLQLSLYDGHRNSRLTLRPSPDDPLVCQGNYRRVNGYPASDLAEQRDFPFVLTYAALPDGRFAVAEVALGTSYGTARVIRD